MIVGGVLGTVKLGWSVWSQVRSRRFEARRHDATATNQDGIGARVADFLLSGFLVLWFVLGNAWIMGIYWPEFEPTRYDPNRWCSQTLYIFSLVHLIIVYSVLGLFFVTVLVLASCQICFCRFLDCK